MAKRNQAGFTLVELIITLILASILLGLGVPAFVDLVDSNRMIAVTNELVGELQYARNEAIKRNNAVTICGTTNGTACNTSSWENGWIVFDDPNVNQTVDGGEVIVRQYGGTNGEPTIRVTAGSNVAGSVSFDGDGFPRTAANLIQRATFSLCDSRGIGGAGTEWARGVELGASGRIRATRNQGVITCP